MQRIFRTAIVLATLPLAACTARQSTPMVSHGDVVLTRADAAADLKQAMRKLWTEHVVWTRGYIVAAIAGDPSATAAANRLMRNQEDIGNAVATYYGAAAGTALTRLLKDHISIAVDLVAAAKAGDNTKLADADRRWKANAGDIAKLLAGANPNWPEANLRMMLNDHLALTTEEATARLQKRWDDEARTYDKIFEQALHMADALTEGIVKQFPAKF
jgi:hypothetical protein